MQLGQAAVAEGEDEAVEPEPEPQSPVPVLSRAQAWHLLKEVELTHPVRVVDGNYK